MLFLQIISKTNDKTLVRNTWAKLNSFRPYPHESGYFLKLHPFFGTNKPFFVHTKPVNPPSETSSCSVKTLAVHTNQGKKICGFKNVRTRVNMASVTANCEKQWRNSMERAFYYPTVCLACIASCSNCRFWRVSLNSLSSIATIVTACCRVCSYKYTCIKQMM